MLDKPIELVAREPEWEALSDLATDSRLGARLGFVYGRRRQGKTFMLELLCEATGGFMFTASQQYGQENLRALSDAYRSYLGTEDPVRFSDWQEAVDALLRLGERGDRPTVVVLDEFSYLLDSQPALPSLLQIGLSPRGRAARQSRTRLILCGSALTTMRKLLTGAAPLRGRTALELNVAPFGYRQAAELWGLSADPELAFKVHALVGGTPAYVGMSNGPVRGEGDFRAWVLRGLLNPASAIFREGNTLLYEQPEVTDATLYFSVLNAIAAGAARRSEIAGRLGRPDGALSHPLTLLEEIRLVEKVEDALAPRRPIYRITEPVIRFHQLIIRSREARIVGGHSREVWEAARETVDSKIYGPHFEDLAREWTLVHASDTTLGGEPSHVRPATVACKHHGRSHEVDVVALAERSTNVLAIGEAKATAGRVGDAALTRLEHLRELIAAPEARLLLFSRSGFTVELRRRVADRGDVELVGLSRLYGGA